MDDKTNFLRQVRKCVQHQVLHPKTAMHIAEQSRLAGFRSVVGQFRHENGNVDEHSRYRVDLDFLHQPHLSRKGGQASVARARHGCPPHFVSIHIKADGSYVVPFKGLDKYHGGVGITLSWRPDPVVGEPLRLHQSFMLNQVPRCYEFRETHCQQASREVTELSILDIALPFVTAHLAGSGE
ncbi:MAG: hypothetical protein DDT36_01767 [Firmicutes bacterium]|nr:hypothetical protein [Bacillota bacterium]